MLGIDRNLTVDGCGNAVNAEHLVFGCVVGFCLHQTLRADFLVESAGDGIFQDAFVCAVSLFGDLAGCTDETGNIQAVMDGDIDGFINAYLKMTSAN